MISRTSVMKYGRGERQDLRSIANALGVTNVVEGTVTRGVSESVSKRIWLMQQEIKQSGPRPTTGI